MDSQFPISLGKGKITNSSYLASCLLGFLTASPHSLLRKEVNSLFNFLRYLGLSMGFRYFYLSQ
jgi:hypothetical protein